MHKRAAQCSLLQVIICGYMADFEWYPNIPTPHIMGVSSHAQLTSTSWLKSPQPEANHLNMSCVRHIVCAVSMTKMPNTRYLKIGRSLGNDKVYRSSTIFLSHTESWRMYLLTDLNGKCAKEHAVKHVAYQLCSRLDRNNKHAAHTPLVLYYNLIFSDPFQRIRREENAFKIQPTIEQHWVECLGAWCKWRVQSGYTQHSIYSIPLSYNPGIPTVNIG